MAVTADDGASQCIPDLLEGDRLSGDEAHELNWLQKVFEPNVLLDETMTYARRLAKESSGFQ